MSLIQTTGNNPQGEAVPLAVSGVVISWNTPLAANEQIQSDIISTAGYSTIFRILSSDQASAAGGIKIEFFDANKQLIPDLTLTSAYNPADGAVQPLAFMLRGQYVRYTYINGPVAQTKFIYNVWLIDGPIQTAAQLLSVPTVANTFSLISKSMLNAFDGTVYRPLDWVDGALKVTVANQSTAIDVSALATKDNQTNGSQHVAIVNGNNQIYGSQASPFNVAVTNYPATQVVSGSVNVSGSVSVSNFPATQAVSATALPLPTGAATAAKQDTGNASLATIASGTIPPATSGAATTYTLAPNVAQTLAAAANRKGVIVNSINGTIFVGLGFTATATSYTYRLVTNGVLEIPEKWAGLSVSLFATSGSTAVITSLT